MALALDPQFVIELTPRPVRDEVASVYLRRRIVAVLAALAALLVVLGAAVGAERALAGRGGVPASAPAAQPAHPPVYVVQRGDTLWSIAERYRGDHSMTGYVEALIRVNGGPELQVGARLSLPG